MKNSDKALLAAAIAVAAVCAAKQIKKTGLRGRVRAWLKKNGFALSSAKLDNEIVAVKDNGVHYILLDDGALSVQLFAEKLDSYCRFADAFYIVSKDADFLVSNTKPAFCRWLAEKRFPDDGRTRSARLISADALKQPSDPNWELIAF